MGYEAIITEAILAGDDDKIQALMDKELLKGAVQRTIFCPLSKVVLDVRTAVYMDATEADGTSRGSAVFDGKVWDDTFAVPVAKFCADNNITLKVVDGRIVHARRTRRS